MKVLFLVFHGLSASNGISKKILSQVKAFADLGIETRFCHYDVESSGNRRWVVDGVTLVDLGRGSIAKFKKRTCYFPILNYVYRENVDLVYIRSDHNANPFTIHFVRSLKKRGCRIVMEIPTFPYDQEYITLESKFHLFWDRCFRHKLASELSAIVSFTNEESIFGQRTIGISNGVDFQAIPLRRKAIRKSQDKDIHLLGVAEIHYWHGFDRVIAGLAEYYRVNPSRKVYFHIVGELSGKREEDEILLPIRNHHLAPYVILHGALWGGDLDKMFDLADFGIGSLGRHRSGISSIRTLKNREYAARGMAFAYSETDPDFDNMGYVLKIPADESPVEIDSVVNFIDDLRVEPQAIRNSVGHLSWGAQIKKVIDQLF